MAKQAENKTVFIHTHRKDFGPFSEPELQRHIKAGRIPFSSWIYQGGKWRLLAEIDGLRDAHPQYEPMPKGEPSGEQAEDSMESLVEPAVPAAGAYAGGGTVSAEPVWFIIRDKKKFGPYSSADIVGQLQRKQLDAGAFVWRPGFPTWQRLNKLAEFSRDSMKKLAESAGAPVDVIVHRKKPRAPYEVEVIAHDNTRAIEGKSMVIGEGGLFLAVARPLHVVGSRLKLHFREGDTPSFNAVAEVVSVVRGDSPGYCMKFVALSESDRRRIAKLISERRSST